jgi:A/G-specific adenine glycosylase
MVSEVMLQQTRVEVVLRYYEPFLLAFPDVESLAAAPVDRVLARWSGLGYYRRARRLHEAARAIVERGGFPRTRGELLALPGIGEYTAAAIASIAFGEAVPVVDGNVERVIARLLDLDADPGSAAGRRRIRAAAAQLVDASAPGESNQALMELGAMVCRPGRPACLLCPVSFACAGRASGRAELLPVRGAARASVRERRVVAVARRAERVLLVRNADGDELLAGIWELPWTPRAPAREDWEAGLAERYGGVWSVGRRRGAAKHGITFRSIDLEVHDAEVTFGPAEVAEGVGSKEPRWVPIEGIALLATTSMVRKVLACLESSAADRAH